MHRILIPKKLQIRVLSPQPTFKSMKVKELIEQLQYLDPDYDLDIVDSDESSRAKSPKIKIEVNNDEQLCLIHWSLNFKPENMENWFPTDYYSSEISEP